MRCVAWVRGKEASGMMSWMTVDYVEAGEERNY